ncbi:hypothetical protein AYO43_00185 [Nitrospira sp. SCGC AG-212-E16]|nr:hypothetical protein AYO43_00185 [Nitrospira sp. SCGC AG-212-E16]
MSRLIRLAVLTFVGVGLISACSPRQFTTITIYDTPTAYVRLEFDRTVKKGEEHSHPISLTPEHIAAVLAGVRVDEPIALVRGDLLERDPVPRIHPAFTNKDITLFAPLLALALSKATPEEVVTFYQTRNVSAVTREVTSGGVFVQGNELHLILANYRSHTRYMADFGAAETTDDRLTPMQSLAPQEGRVDFEPESAKQERPVGGLGKLFHWDHRELAVLYKQLPPRPLVQLTP